MIRHKRIMSVLLVPCAWLLMVPGCSDKTFTTTSVAVPDDATPTAYLPLEVGLRVSYVVLEPGTGNFDVEVTDPVSVAGYRGFQIRRTDQATGGMSYCYRYAKGNAIFESDRPDEPGLRILEAPFVIGNRWDRYDTSITISAGGGVDPQDDGDTTIIDAHKRSPGAAYSTMTIVGLEDVVAMNGRSYGHCIKVAWPVNATTINYYWYAANIGLVKYEYGVSTQGTGSGYAAGVMTDYQIVKY
jgi:hypothetical protein